MTLSDAFNLFILRYANPFTAKNYRKVLQPLIALHPAAYLSDITEHDLLTWSAALRERNLAPSTFANYNATARIFFNWCVERGYLDHSPARDLPVSFRRDPRSRAIPGEVLTAMFEHLVHKPTFSRLRDTALLAVLTAFGARRGDAHRLRVSDVDLANSHLHMVVKGGKHHILPIPPQTAAILDAWITYRARLPIEPPHDMLFVANQRRPPSYQPMALASVNSTIQRLSQRVCGKKYGPHSIRHWRGQSLADCGVPATVIQQVLGHSNVKTTLTYYFNQDDERVKAAIAAHELPAPARPAPTTNPQFWRRSG